MGARWPPRRARAGPMSSRCWRTACASELWIVVEVETTEELEREALARADWADVVLMAAAVADYRPAQRQPGKRERSGAW